MLRRLELPPRLLARHDCTAFRDTNITASSPPMTLAQTYQATPPPLLPLPLELLLELLLLVASPGGGGEAAAQAHASG